MTTYIFPANLVQPFMPNHILVTGSLAFDLIMDFPGKFADHIDPSKIHLLNLSFLVNKLKKEQGGTAGNIAYTLALLKTKVAILGSVGEDFGKYGQFLNQAGVDTSQVKIIKDESTSQAFMITDQNDNQLSAFYPGAMSSNTTLKITTLPKPNLVVISPNHPQAMVNFAQECQKLKVPYLFDPGMQLPALADQQLFAGIKKAEILIGNDYETGLLKSRLKMSTAELLKFVKVTITTLGNRGSVIETNEQKINIKPGLPREVADPTGAGDAYRAGFIAGYLRGFALETCGRMGSIASCYAIEKYGTTNHTFSTAQFCHRFFKNFKTKLEL